MKKPARILLFFFWFAVPILPILPILPWSLAYGWPWPGLLPSAWTGRAWQDLLSPSSSLEAALANSLWIALLVTCLALVLGLPAGAALAQGAFRGQKTFAFFFYLPILVPGAAAAMGLAPWFFRLGLAGTLAGVVLVHLVPTLPYLIRAAAIGFESLDPRLEEQARTLGATPWQAWRGAMLPALAPALAAGAGLVFLISFSQYLPTLLIGGGRIITLPLLLFPFVAGNDQAVGAALSLVFALPGLAVFWFLDSWLKGNRLEVRL